jgi:quercetin 2,3-dioxygenase
MLQIRRAHERGHANHGWLEARHTFSFADYHDPAHMGFRTLRVINEDRVQPGAGFPTHGHRDMEIVTWILEGALKHEDSMGNGSIIRPGEAQYMSAGRGVLHSEFNASKTEPVHLLQIWILPAKAGEVPRYGQRDFSGALDRGGLVPVATPDGREGSLAIRQDTSLVVARLDGAREVAHELAPGRHAWVQVARGALEVNGRRLEQGSRRAGSASSPSRRASAPKCSFSTWRRNAG